jgi:hypothetical protein
MVLGLSSSGAIKIKTDEEGGGLRAVECACCNPPIPCNLYPASNYQTYFENNNSLPNEIYIGGTRSFQSTQITSVVENAPAIPAKLWGAVNGGLLLNRNATSYGDITNGAILEQEGNIYTWAIYKNGVRSTAGSLVDGINRHDNFATSYNVSMDYFYPLQPANYNIYRISCVEWSPLVYAPYAFWGCVDTFPSWFVIPPSEPWTGGNFIYHTYPQVNPTIYLGGYGGGYGGGGLPTYSDSPESSECGGTQPYGFFRTLVPSPLLKNNADAGITGEWGTGGGDVVAIVS